MTRILITGAAGRLGQHLTKHLHERYELILSDRKAPAERYGCDFHEADISERVSLAPLFVGVDTVIHLAADARVKADWDSLLANNISGVYNIFEAATRASVKRVIYASSVNAVAGYPADVQVKTSMPVAPPNLYGASKAAGEALGRYYADQRGLSVLCLRLGWVIDKAKRKLEPEHPLLDIALTLADLCRLIDCCLAAPDELRFGIFHGSSDNRFKRLDISDTRQILGFAPEDDAYVLAGVVTEERPDHLFENK